MVFKKNRAKNNLAKRNIFSRGFSGWRKRKLEEKLSNLNRQVLSLSRTHDLKKIKSNVDALEDFLSRGGTDLSEISGAAASLRHFLHDSFALRKEIKSINRWFRRIISKDHAYIKLVLGLSENFNRVEADLKRLSRVEKIIGRKK